MGNVNKSKNPYCLIITRLMLISSAMFFGIRHTAYVINENGIISSLRFLILKLLEYSLIEKKNAHATVINEDSTHINRKIDSTL